MSPKRNFPCWLGWTGHLDDLPVSTWWCCKGAAAAGRGPTSGTATSGGWSSAIARGAGRAKWQRRMLNPTQIPQERSQFLAGCPREFVEIRKASLNTLITRLLGTSALERFDILCFFAHLGCFRFNLDRREPCLPSPIYKPLNLPKKWSLSGIKS